MNIGELHVWLIHIDKLSDESLPEPTHGELARAAHFRSGALQRRYLRSHRVPELKFSLPQSKSMAALAAALHVEVGVDIEKLRPLTDYMGIADRYLPPTAAAEFAAVFQPDPARESFRRREDAPLPCPIRAYGGLDDARISRQHLEAWREQTTADFRLRQFPGEHFYFRNLRAFLDALAEDL